MKAAVRTLAFVFALVSVAELASASKKIRLYRVNEQTFDRTPVAGSTFAEQFYGQAMKIQVASPSVVIADKKIEDKNKKSISVSNFAQHKTEKKVDEKTPTIKGILVSNLAAQKTPKNNNGKDGKNNADGQSGGHPGEKKRMGIPVKNLIENDGPLQPEGAVEIKEREDGYWVIGTVEDFDEHKGVTIRVQRSETHNTSFRATFPPEQILGFPLSGYEAKHE